MRFPRPTPRLLCTAAKQKNSGQNLEEDVGQTDQKTDAPCAEKMLTEEKAKLEEQLKDTMVRPQALWEGGRPSARRVLNSSQDYGWGLQHAPAREGTGTQVPYGSGSATRLAVTCYVDCIELRFQLVFTDEEH